MISRRASRVLVLTGLAALLAAPGVPLLAAEEASRTVRRPFTADEPIALDLTVQGVRIPELRIAPTEGRLLDSVLPPRGGQRRFSYLAYRMYAENPVEDRARLRAHVRLLDREGRVIDEFGLTERIGKNRAETIELRRLTLDYVVPLIDEVELTVAVER